MRCLSDSIRHDVLSVQHGHHTVAGACAPWQALRVCLTCVTRPAGICVPEQRQQMVHNAAPATGWNPWLWAWVGSEDVASAHRLLMEGPDTLPLHDVYYLTADDTTALEPSAELIARFQPALLPFAAKLRGYQAFFSSKKLTQAVGWQHHTAWREKR